MRSPGQRISHRPISGGSRPSAKEGGGGGGGGGGEEGGPLDNEC